MTRLPYLLSVLEETWRGLGFPPEKAYSRGLEPSEVREALRGVTKNPCEEIVEWFGWHDGPHDPEGGLIEAAPSGFSPMSLERALEERAIRLEGAAEGAQWARSVGGLDNPPEYWWEPTWLPIGASIGPWVLVVDVEDSADRQGQAVVYNVEWQNNPAFRQPAAASLCQAVRFWILTLEAGYYRWSDEEGWTHDWDTMPPYLRVSPLLG